MPGRTVVFLGGADTLQLDEDGKVYTPGDTVQMPDAQRAGLMQAGLRFGAVPDEPEAEPASAPPPALESADVSAAVIDNKPLPVAPPTPDTPSARAKEGK